MGYKDRVEKAKKARSFKLEEGIHKCRLIGWSFGKSKKNNDMFTLEWKIREVPEDAQEGYLEKIVEKKRNIKMTFMPMLDFQFDMLLEFLEACGANLNSFDDSDESFSDIKDCLNEIEEVMPSVSINVVPRENTQYPNYYFRDLKDMKACIEPKPDFVPTETAEVPTTPEAPSAPAVEEPVSEYTKAELIANGWTEEQIAIHHPNAK